MSWLAVDKDGNEGVFDRRPRRTRYGYWVDYDEDSEDSETELPNGTIKKLIGRELTWNDKPVELEYKSLWEFLVK